MTQPTSQQPEMDSLSRTQVLMAMGVTAVLLLLVAKLWLYFDRVPLLSLRWHPWHLLLGVGIAVGITGASALVYQFWSPYRRSADFYLRLVLQPLLWPDLLWLGLLPGLSEELLFRGVILPALGLNWLGVIGSSLCFGVLHLSGLRQWPYMIWATFVGLLLGFAAWETHNLLVPTIAHVLTNWIASSLWKLEHRQQSYL